MTMMDQYERMLWKQESDRSQRTLRRPSGDEGSVIELSEPRRWASSLGASGMAGIALLSPNALWLWLEYFWWNGEGIMSVEMCRPDI